VDIRKRMRSDRFDLWNELIAEKADVIKPKRRQRIGKVRDDRETPTGNKGTLKYKKRVRL